MFRFVIFLIFLCSFLNKITSQCLYNAISAAFNFECNAGDPTGARLGIDSVVFVVPNPGNYLVGGTGIQIFKNGLPVFGSVTIESGDELKIKPNAIGLGNIGWDTDQPGCPVSGAVNFTICSAPMPILFQSQPIAKVQNNKTLITWSVGSQLNNDKYIIEHSKYGNNFSPIGEIAEDGTNNKTKHYEYIHKSPSIGINYYRIKQVDYDGKYSYSDLASVRYDGNGETNIYPNPATSEVTITTTASTSLQIMDVYGRVLRNEDISEGQNTINLSELPNGILIFVVGDQRYMVLKE